jgi:GNAT superfamily N-acetyltransferase
MDPSDKEGEAMVLFDGTPAFLRPLRPDDAEALARFHTHLSPATVRRRFLCNHPVLTPGEVEHFTHLDGVDRAAFVVCTTSDLIAIGRYERIGTAPEAEVAFVVADAHQHHGLGSLLFERLVERARVVGIGTFSAETLAENGAMLAIFRDSGYPMRATTGAGVVDVAVDIGRPSTAILCLSAGPTTPAAFLHR